MITIKFGQPGLYSFFRSPFSPGSLPDLPYGPDFDDSVPCPSCYGTGVVPHPEFDCDLDCSECGGSGLSFPFSAPSVSPIPVECSADGAGAGGISSEAAPAHSVADVPELSVWEFVQTLNCVSRQYDSCRSSPCVYAMSFGCCHPMAPAFSLVRGGR